MRASQALVAANAKGLTVMKVTRDRMTRLAATNSHTENISGAREILGACHVAPPPRGMLRLLDRTGVATRAFQHFNPMSVHKLYPSTVNRDRHVDDMISLYDVPLYRPDEPHGEKGTYTLVQFIGHYNEHGSRIASYYIENSDLDADNVKALEEAHGADCDDLTDEDYIHRMTDELSREEFDGMHITRICQIYTFENPV